MQTLSPGQNTVLERTRLVVQLDPQVGIPGGMTGVALLLNAADKAADRRAYVGDANPEGAGGAVAFDAGNGTFRVDLGRLGPEVEKVRLGMALLGGPSTGRTMADLRAVETAVTDDLGARLLAFPLDLAGRTETAMILLDLYRRHGAWRAKAVGQGFVHGLNALGRAHGLDIVEAQDGRILVRDGRSPDDPPAPEAGDERRPPPPPGTRYSGTGFCISRDGFFLTNEHVIRDGRRFTARNNRMEAALRVAFADPINDLALLQAERAVGEPTAFRDSLHLDPGEDVVTVGYPLSGLLGSNAQVTTGAISALTGTANDSRVLQFTAPVQTGNSGGPLFDAYGLVVGIVSHKLNAEQIHRITGDIPQNVNFAVKGAVARAFLLAAGIEPPTADIGSRQSAAAIASAARDRVVQVLVEA
ncbi:MAG: trypsin-like peptidase domain-containing protein [Rhodospirillaceae bacterium]|nr:trypsin-like peptidase domain-containing protein [Rhodospirillaceae bacterium]